MPSTPFCFPPPITEVLASEVALTTAATAVTTFLPVPAAPASAVEHRAALDVELFAQGARALAQARETRPRNTNKTYDPKQKEWQQFCAEKGFEDGELVCENKLIWFLNERVLDRELRTSRYTKKVNRTTADGELVRQTLGPSAIKSYVAAIVDLWSFQKSKGINTHPTPRGEGLNGLLRARQRAEHKRRRLEFTDRAAGTLQDGYTEAKMIDAIRFCWGGYRQRKQQSKQSTEPYLRTAVDFLLAHNMLLRSEARLQAELPDFFTVSLRDEGPTPCYPMIMIMDNGKTNPMGRLEYGAVMRHRNPLLCTMAHTAFYFFYRWNVAGEPPPSFRRRELWYSLHLIKGEHTAKMMTYDTQLGWINKMFAGANVMSLKKTHAGRSQGARHAELKGVSEGQIRRAGRWNSDSLTNCYLTQLPRKFIRSMAGFSPSAQGSFYLPRAKVLPPRSLEQAVWPFVDKWLAWFDSYADGREEEKSSHADDDDDDDDDRTDLAAQGFLRLLQQLRIILLQDSVVMRQEFPAHPIWADPIFARADYLAFAKDVELSLLDVEEPEEVQIRKTLPAIAERLSILQQGLTREVNDWGAETRERLNRIEIRLGDLLEGRISLTLHPTTRHTTITASSGSATPASAAMTVRPAAAAALFSQEQPQPEPEPEPEQEQEQERLQLRLQPAPPPSYVLSRAVTTVPQLWREWTVGLTGGPSVQGLEDLYGSRWRQKHSEQVFYGRRKVIIDEVRRRQAQGMSIGAAVEEVELVRQRGQLSLYQLYQVLNKQKKCAS